MANPYGPGDRHSHMHGQPGVTRTTPYEGYTGYEHPHQNYYPPLHNQSNPSFVKSQNNLNMSKNENDVVVSERSLSRTPSPSPSESAMLNRKGFVDWRKMMKWRFWIRKEWLWYYVILGVILVLVILISVYDRQIVQWLKPTAVKIKDMPAGWVIPIAILFIISFPPLFGHEIIAILCGVVWGLWVGFAITAVGTFLGEIGNFYAFRYCCRARGEKLEKTDLQYACLARVVREGGFKIALIARYSAIPGHFTTAIFSTCGMGILVFALAAFLSLPKQFVTVYIGVIIEASGTGTETTRDRVISEVVLAVTAIITFVAMWYLYRKMDEIKQDVIYKRRKARQAKLERANSAGGSSDAFNPRESDSDLPLNPTAAYQHWDSHGRAVGYAGNPNLNYSVHAPSPRAAGVADVTRIPTYRSEGGGGYSSSGVRYGAAPGLDPSTSTSRAMSPSRAVQRQESADTAEWDMVGQGMGPDAYHLPTIGPHTPLTGGFADARSSTNNPFAPRRQLQEQQQQMYPHSPVYNPFSSSENIPSSSSSVPPPLAPPPKSPTQTYDVPFPATQYQQQQRYLQQQSYPAGPPRGQVQPPYQPTRSLPYGAALPTAPIPFQQHAPNVHSNPPSVPHSPLQTPMQHAFAYQPAENQLNERLPSPSLPSGTHSPPSYRP